MRETIDYGIDLGTTNSSLAVANAKGNVRVIVNNNNNNSPVTPSAVWIKGNDKFDVGLEAVNAFTSPRNMKNVALEFKRQMGTDWVFPGDFGGQPLTAQFLSSKVLAELLTFGGMMQREEIQAAVITIPAGYGEAQRQAVHGAAKLAGLKSYLIPEPAAAAAAYSYEVKSGDARWLVYDFGGGTFDAALLRVSPSGSEVEAHDGLNFVGGKDIDWGIVDKKLMPELARQLGLQGFYRSDEKVYQEYFVAIHQLKAAAESAKIKMSMYNSVTLPLHLLAPNSASKLTEFNLELTRAELEVFAEPHVTATIKCVHDLLRGKGIGVDDIERMFLVGGPTLMPYIKGRLESELINRLEFSIDPFTVVAQGAALTASRIRMAEVIPPVRPDETYALNLQFSPSGPGAEFRVEGQVEAPEKGTVLNGFTLIARREPGGSTTRVIVNPDGRFTDYLAVETGENIFILELLNEQGVSQAIAAAEQRLKRTRDDEMPPPTAPNIPISRSIGVVLSDDSFDRVLIRGRDSHPANVTRAYVTTVGVEPGTADRIIHIPIMEGERTRGDRNRQIGFINISAEELRRTLPAGTHVQVTIRLESSGQSWVEAFVPVVGQRFKAELKLIIQAPDLSTLKDEYEAEMKRSDELMDQIKELAGNDPTEADRGRKVKDELETMEGRMSELRLRAQTQGEALQQLEPALLEFQAQTDELEAISDWLALIVAQQKNVDFMQSEVDSAGTPEDKQKAKTIQLRMQQALKGKKAEELKKVGADANTLGSNIYFRSPKNWERHFNKLKRDFEARPEDYANQQKIKEILASASPNGNAGSFRDSVIDLETTMDVNPPPPGSKVGSTVKRA